MPPDSSTLRHLWDIFAQPKVHRKSAPIQTACNCARLCLPVQNHCEKTCGAGPVSCTGSEQKKRRDVTTSIEWGSESFERVHFYRLCSAELRVEYIQQNSKNSVLKLFQVVSYCTCQFFSIQVLSGWNCAGGAGGHLEIEGPCPFEVPIARSKDRTGTASSPWLPSKWATQGPLLLVTETENIKKNCPKTQDRKKSGLEQNQKNHETTKASFQSLAKLRSPWLYLKHSVQRQLIKKRKTPHDDRDRDKPQRSKKSVFVCLSCLNTDLLHSDDLGDCEDSASKPSECPVVSI